MQDAAAAGEVTLPDLTVFPSQRITLPSSTQQPRQDPAGHASDTKGAAKTPPETPGSSERANQHPTSESEQRNGGGGAGPQRLTGNKQQLQRPKRSDASVEKIVSATEAIVERQGEPRLLVIPPVSRETEESSITAAAEDFKAHTDSDLTVPAAPVQSRHTEGSTINVSAIEIEETQELLDRRDTESPKPQTSPQRADAETETETETEAEAGQVEVDDVHTHTVLEHQRYNNVTQVFQNSTQPSSDLSSDLTTGESFFQSNSKSTSEQPPTDTITRKGTKLRPGVRGQRVRFSVYLNHSVKCSLHIAVARMRIVFRSGFLYEKFYKLMLQ